jgi:hypothetical protein
VLGHLLLLHHLAEGSSVTGAVLADDPWMVEDGGGTRRVSDGSSRRFRGNLGSSRPRGKAGAETSGEAMILASLQRKNPKNTRTRSVTRGGRGARCRCTYRLSWCA